MTIDTAFSVGDVAYIIRDRLPIKVTISQISVTITEELNKVLYYVHEGRPEDYRVCSWDKMFHDLESCQKKLISDIIDAGKVS